MKALARIRDELLTLAEDMRAADPENDDAHRVWVIAQKIEAQTESIEKGIAE